LVQTADHIHHHLRRRKSVKLDRMIDGVAIVLVEHGHGLKDRLNKTRVRERRS
jgi:hypothetical protein